MYVCRLKASCKIFYDYNLLTYKQYIYVFMCVVFLSLFSLNSCSYGNIFVKSIFSIHTLVLQVCIFGCMCRYSSCTYMFILRKSVFLYLYNMWVFQHEICLFASLFIYFLIFKHVHIQSHLRCWSMKFITECFTTR